MLDSIGPSFAHQTIFGLGVPLRLPAALNFLSFWVVAIPIGAVIAARGGLGLLGLWLGLDLGMLLLVCGVLTSLAAASQAAAERAAGGRKATRRSAACRRDGAAGGGGGGGGWRRGFVTL